ncbi:MAG: hypothetical protein DRN68_08625 [Thaumarchaeota archaeon]|nr:MAG: hypothetical protein DRN68_08625 [Nitrososphaerota archaeon]
MDMRRRERGEVPRMALTYFATRREGHAYGFQKEFEIERYCSAQAAVKLLERNGWIYPVRVDIGGRGYVRKKVYRLSAMGFIEFLRENIVLELARKAFEVHRELCPAFFTRLVKLGDDDLRMEVEWIRSRGFYYFWDADLDNYTLEEVDMAAPFIFCGMLLDYKATRPSLGWKNIGFNDEESSKLDSHITSTDLISLNLTMGEVQEAFLLDQVESDRSDRSRAFTVRRVRPETAERLEKNIERSWMKRSEAWREWVKSKNPQTLNPMELMANTIKIKLKILERRVQFSSKLLEALESLHEPTS